MKNKKTAGAPFIKNSSSTRSIMLDVLIALFPALIWSVYVFGVRVITIIVVSVISAVLSEAVFEAISRKPFEFTDLSSVVTGMILAFFLPVSVPLYVPAAGSAFAVVAVKMIFGGIGKNFMNPALGGVAFLWMTFPEELSRFTKPFVKLPTFALTVSEKAISDASDRVTLTEMKLGESLSSETVNDLLIGKVCGNIGEVSAVMLLLGLFYLVIKRIVSPGIPLAFTATVFLIGFFFPRAAAEPITVAQYEILSGGVILAASFAATDPVTSPMTYGGRLIFGAGCGALTMLIRSYGAFNEGVVFAVLIMNIFVGVLDKMTAPVVFGGKKK